MNTRTLITLLFVLTTGLGALGAKEKPMVNPVSSYANDPVWRDRFIASYGVLSGREPKISADDLDLIKTVQEFIPDNLPAAISTLEAALTPESSPALYFILGNFYFQSDNLSRAKFNYEKAVKLFPDFLRVYKNLGLLEFRDENYDKAIDYLSKSINLGDTDARTFGMLGYCNLNKEKYLSAEQALRVAILGEPDNKDWKMLLAQTLLAQEKYREANSLFSELLLDSPDNTVLWLAQANTFMGLEEMDKAASNFEIVRRMGKASPESLILLGDIYINKQMLELALEAYMAAIDEDPNQKINSPLRAAESLTNYGAYKEAQTLINKIDAVYANRMDEPSELKLLTLKSQIAISTGKAEEAAVVLEQIIERDPLNGRALITLANYYGQVNEIERAIILYERAEELEERIQKQAFLRHGQLMVKLKRWEEAVDILRRAVNLDPQNKNLQEYLDQVEKVARASGVVI